METNALEPGDPARTGEPGKDGFLFFRQYWQRARIAFPFCGICMMKPIPRHRFPWKTLLDAQRRQRPAPFANPLGDGQNRWIRFNRYVWDKRKG